MQNSENEEDLLQRSVLLKPKTSLSSFSSYSSSSPEEVAPFYPFYQPCSTTPSPFPQRERAAPYGGHRVVATCELSALNYNSTFPDSVYARKKTGGLGELEYRQLLTFISI